MIPGSTPEPAALPPASTVRQPTKAARLQRALASFACRRCGRCCEGAGLVHVKAEEVDAMAAALGLDPYEFTARYARLSANRRDLLLHDREDGACILLSAAGECRVQAAKPQQCRDFPYTWNYPGYEERCEGMRTALGGLCENGGVGVQDVNR